MSPGDLLDGRYQIVRPIGRGGMGSVYEAIQLDLGRRVAVKVLEPGAEVLRLAQEARALAALNHPNVVAIVDARPDATPPFLAMDLVPGRSLAELIAESGRIEPRRAAILARQLLSALAAAHDAGIIHRDVKPSNVLIVSGGPVADLVKVVDFGIAKLTIDPMKQTTRGVLLGSLAYMAPEQILGVPVDARVDIFATGVTLYEMLSGRPPFDGESAPRVAAAICQEEPPVLVAPADLVAIVRRAMKKDPAARFTTADEMGRALEAFVAAASPASPSNEAQREVGPSALAFTAGPYGPGGALPMAAAHAVPFPPGPPGLPGPPGPPGPRRPALDAMMSAQIPPAKGWSPTSAAVVGVSVVVAIVVAVVTAIAVRHYVWTPQPTYDGSTIAMDVDPKTRISQAEEDAIRRRLNDFARCFRSADVRAATMDVVHLESVTVRGAKSLNLGSIGCAEGVDRAIPGVRRGTQYHVRF
ncbi:MAG: serine/threonine protein kinase [Deltaproteobacteria bacterium]|nr:serine/threonine protein kinase [Deltaproteobacteria bacterium]